MNKVQDVVQIHPPHGFAEPGADGTGPSAAAAPSAAEARKRRKNNGAMVEDSIAAIDSGPMGECSAVTALGIVSHA